VVADFHEGRPNALEEAGQVWDYVSARWEFLEYVQKEVGDYLGSQG